jgi:hypothetical protein
VKRGSVHWVADLAAVGLLGPGLSNWTQGREVLRGAAPLIPQPTVIPASATLPPAERRRAVRVVNLAMAVGHEATVGIAAELGVLPTVFASSVADTTTCDDLLRTLASAERQVSPTRFHNSVHNVAAGYWSIATGDTASYTMVCAYDGSFAAGLIEALSLVATSESKVMLIAYDLDYPSPLREKRAIADAFAVALLLRPQAAAAAICRLTCSLGGASVDKMSRPELESMRLSAPAARALPLLEIIARGQEGSSRLAYLDNLSLLASVAPCH